MLVDIELRPENVELGAESDVACVELAVLGVVSADPSPSFVLLYGARDAGEEGGFSRPVGPK